MKRNWMNSNEMKWTVIDGDFLGVHSSVSGATSATPMQLPIGIAGRIRPVRSAASHANGATLRSAG